MYLEGFTDQELDIIRWSFGMLAPPRKLTVEEWARQNRIISSKAGSARPGKWDTANAPYTLEPMQCFTDPRIETIVLAWGAQLGKSELLINQMQYVIDVDPGPMLFTLATEDSLTDVIDRRLRPTFEETQAIMRHAPGGKNRGMTHDCFEYDRMVLHFGNMQSPSSLRSWPIRYLFMDELDDDTVVYKEGDPLELARKRTNTFWNRKIVLSSTATKPWRPMWREFLASDQRQWFVPCLKCGFEAPFRFANLHWDARPAGLSHMEFANRVKDRRAAIWYECENCKQEHEDRDKMLMNERGKWVAQRETGPVAGFHLTSLASQFYSWFDLVHDWLKSQGDPEKLKVFVNTVFCEPWKEKTASAEPNAVLDRIAGGLKTGIVPAWTKLLTAGVDVQEDRVFWSVWAIGANRRMHKVTSGSGQWLDEFATEVMDTAFYVEGTIDRSMAVQLALIDSRYRTTQVHEWCFSQKPFIPVRPTQGRGGKNTTSRHTEKVRKVDTEIVPGSGRTIDKYILETNQLKDLLWSLFERAATSEGAMSFNLGTDATFADQFTAEEKAQGQDPQGFTYFYWQKKAGRNANHYWDTSVYALAAGELLGAAALIPGADRQKPVKTAGRQDRNTRNRERDQVAGF